MRFSIFLLTIIIFIGCKTHTKYIPLESVKLEYREKIWRDSIHVYDSVYVHSKRDSIFLERYKYIYKNKLVRDSIYITDSIQVPFPVIETKEINKLKKWQLVLMWSGAISLIILSSVALRKIKLFK